MKKKIFLLTLILLSLVGCENNEKEETKSIVESNGMLSYTIDGSPATEKPTKENGYIVNSIKCDNGSILVWDNDNWQVELTELKGSDRCIVDFTNNTSNPGYRVTATSNIENVLDSYSKATTNGGTVEIYTKNEIEIKSVSGCTGTIENNKAIITNVTQNQTCNIEIDPTLANYVKLAYKPQPGRTNFSEIDNGTPKGSPEGQTGGLYKGIDDQGITYYFSGDGSSMKNWVEFAGKKWRIIRINGNGSVRLLYTGDGNTGSASNNYNGVGSTGKNAFNSTYKHPAYVGWKYTSGNSLSTNRNNGTPSTIYNSVNTWYTGLSADNKKYIDSNAIYCNDRNIGSGEYSTDSTFYYAAYTRLQGKQTPIFTCAASDQFKDGFGLMTADEVVAAGGLYVTPSPKAYYYLNAAGNGSITGDKWWWTMSPCHWDGSSANVFLVYGSSNPGLLSRDWVSISHVVRPVISLKPEVQVTTGDGSADSPYKVILP